MSTTKIVGCHTVESVKIRNNEGLTFEDVLLVPKHSSIGSRSSVDTSTRLTRSISLRIPLISANMDTVTESAMAIALARLGGIGAIHRFMTIERQVAEVLRVKRAESCRVEFPATITASTAIREAQALMEHSDISGLLVLADDGELVGILTRRDLLLAPTPSLPITQVMTPRERLITAPATIGIEEAQALLHTHRIEKLPLLDEYGCIAGLITAKDLMKGEKYPHATKDDKGRLRVAAAIGARQGDLKRAEALVSAGVDLLIIDIAHGDSQQVLHAIGALKKEFPSTEVAAGNVATAEGVHHLAAAGADAIKVGVGAGSICLTRIVTGFGVPQLTAILDCVEAAQGYDIPIIADGGIKSSGDLTKALAAGAESAMVGSILAGTEESPGASIIREGHRFKVIRGMASLSANLERKTLEITQQQTTATDWEQVVPEGTEALVPYRGHVSDLIYQLIGGLRSGMSYANARHLRELRENAELIRITQSGIKESYIHSVKAL